MIAVVVLGRGQAAVPDLGNGADPVVGGAGQISVSPVRSVVPAETPQTTLEYTIGNTGDAEKIYEASAAELDSNGTPISAATGDAVLWVSFDQSRIAVPSGGSTPVAVRVDAPTDRGAEERRVGVTFAEVIESSGVVGMATAVTTSVYVQGAGIPTRSTRVEDLSVPTFATGAFSVTATLINDGTVTVVPGATDGGIAGTISDGGQPFIVAGDPVRPAPSGALSGTVTESPLACWCQVRVTVADGNGDVSSVDARVLIPPWWLVGTIGGLVALLLLLAALRRALSKRRIASQDAPGHTSQTLQPKWLLAVPFRDPLTGRREQSTRGWQTAGRGRWHPALPCLVIFTFVRRVHLRPSRGAGPACSAGGPVALYTRGQRQGGGAMTTAPDPASAIAHAVLAGIAVGAVTFAGSLLAVPLLFAGMAGLAVLAVLPLIATALLLTVSRTVTGRLHAGANLALGALLTLATLAAVVAPLVADAPPLPDPLLAALPLLVGAAAASGSLIVHPGRPRIIGAVTTVALVAVVASPVVQTVLGRTAAARASQQAEFEARLDSSVVPFESEQLTTTAVAIGQYESSVRASEDPLARQDDDYLPDPGDVTILTSRFDPEYTLEIQICSRYTSPELAGTAGNTCERRNDGVWVLEVDGSPMLARLIDYAVVSVSGTDQDRLEELLVAVVPMKQDEYERRVRLAFERDLRA